MKKSGALDILSLYKLDDLSNTHEMTKAVLTTPEIEQRALDLGANRAAVYKWRERGVPSKWQMRLVKESNGEIKPDDFVETPKEAASA